METLTHYSPPTSFDAMSTPEPQQQFLKLEDLHQPSSASPAPSSFDGCTVASASPPPPVIVQSKPAKKRKSWGQELPEPKTNLPPRKRAKTEDEKEQRRIERIKRNRAAAHNSRERKRQETETLAVALARANAELDAYRKLHGPLPPSIVLPEVTLSSETPASVGDAHEHGSVDEAISRPSSPVDSLFKSSPRTIKQEPLESTLPAISPPTFATLDPKYSVLTPTSLPLDQTQHSAAMLCDLPCRSSRNDLSVSNRPPTYPNCWWMQFLLSLMAFQVTTCYKTLLMALWTCSPSRMTRILAAAAAATTTTMSASAQPRTFDSTTSSTTPQYRLRLTRRRLALSFDSATGLRAPLSVRGASAAPPRPSVSEVRPSEGQRSGEERRVSPCPTVLRRQQQDSHHLIAREDRCHGRDGVDQNQGVGPGRVT